LPRARRTSFAWTITGGLVLAAALSHGMAWLVSGPLREWLAEREAAWLEAAVEAAPFSFTTAVFLESPGNGVVFFPLSILVATMFARRRQPLLAFGTLAAAWLSALVVGSTWLAWTRERPTFLYPDLPPSELSALPSGHMATSIPLFGLLTWLWCRRSGSTIERMAAVMLLAAVIAAIGLARIVLSAHWPSDIAAGVVLGGFWLAVVIVALQRGEEAGGGSVRTTIDRG
jgi:membrane-associated phospholipid phosphatase